MTMEGPRDPVSPDVSARVMARLGYARAASADDARRIRVRRAAVMAGQACVVLAACALGVVWWWTRDDASRNAVPVTDVLRGTVAQGSGQIDRVIGAMPRVPQTSTLRASGAVEQAPDAPSAALENAPQLRSY